MTNKQYKIAIVLCVLLIAVALFGPEVFYHATHERPARVIITQSVTDERGLTSVQFIQDGKEWGLDYLTPQELDSLKNIH